MKPQEEATFYDELIYSDSYIKDFKDNYDPTLLTLNRGTYENLVPKLLDFIDAKKDKEDIAQIIQEIQGRKANYSGIYYKIYFRVDQPIQLVDIGFYGPFKESNANYNIQIEILKPKKEKETYPDLTNACRISYETFSQINAQKQNIFYIHFKESVFIYPQIWHLIQFRLDGPDTVSSTKTWETVQIKAANGKNIQFEFGAGGSKQLPSLRFKLVDLV